MGCVRLGVGLAAAMVATLVALAITPAGAIVAPIKECGDYRPTGGYAVFNITSRVTSCRTARRMARTYYQGRWKTPRRPGRSFQRGSYTCRYRLEGIEGVDMRCTASSGRVVRFQASS